MPWRRATHNHIPMPRFSKRKRQSIEAARAPRSRRRALPSSPAEPPATATATLNVDVEASPVTSPPDAATPLTPTPPTPPLAQDDLHAN
jgi:hypothetical protein